MKLWYSIKTKTLFVSDSSFLIDYIFEGHISQATYRKLIRAGKIQNHELI